MLAEVETAITDNRGPVANVCYYEKTSFVQVVDMACVQCLVGRFEIVKNRKRMWAIIDRSGGLAQAVWARDGDEDN